jgi:acetyltransferase-like isoleucine patch superfamily enzyme
VIADALPTEPSKSPTSTIGHANRVVEREGWLERARYHLRHLLLFGYNRVVGQLPGHALRNAYLRHVLGWQIGERSSIHHGLKLFGGRGRVRIGRRSTLQMDCLIVGAGMDQLTIGDNVAIAYRACLAMGSHDMLSPSFAGVTGPIVVEDHVFIGTGAIILHGVTLGEGTVVTAGSVVTKSTPPYSIVRGNPAQIVGRRPRRLNYSAEHFWPFH